jgi:hypothetical protein
MQSKLSVILLKGRNIDETSDMNKMAVHLEQILSEKDGIDLKIRQSITDAMLKSVNFIVFCGYDTTILSEFFKSLSAIEAVEGQEGPTVFLYEEPGQSIWEHLNYILREGMDLGRVSPKVFNKVVDVWSYHDIINTINISLKRLGTNATNDNSPSTLRGNASEVVGARPVEA